MTPIAYTISPYLLRYLNQLETLRQQIILYPLSPKREVPPSIPRPDYAEDGIPKSERKFTNRNNIAILDKEGQDAMRKVCLLAREVLDIAARAIKPGVTTDYLDEIVHNACIERNVCPDFVQCIASSR